MDTTQLIVAVLGSAGVSAFLVAVVNGAVKYFNGTAGRERVRNVGLKDQRNEAWADAEKERDRADCEARNRRRIEEYASQLRRDCTEHGVTDKELRPWPRLEQTPEDRS